MSDNGENGKKMTAGIIIIGDEILKGQTQDSNSYFLARRLHQNGIKVEKILTLSDEVTEIADGVRSFSEKYSVVLTSGGIGPTHDDITMEGVALAFDDKIVPHPTLVEMCQKWFKTDDLQSPAMKLAHIPSMAILNYNDKRPTNFPLISVKNVFIFPGIPKLLIQAFNNLEEKLFRNMDITFHVAEIYTNKHEILIAHTLNEFVVKYKDSVCFGSYPELDNSYFKTKVTIQSTDPHILEKVKKEFGTKVDSIFHDPEPQRDAMKKIESLCENTSVDFQGFLLESLSSLRKCCNDYKTNEICMCFNGGKDSIAALHLFYAVLQEVEPNIKMQVLYVREKNSFLKIEEFVKELQILYNMDCTIYEGSIKESLIQMLKKNPNIKACILGTRHNDPSSSRQSIFSYTDENWPRLMRVNPVFNWSYEHIWIFIRSLSLKYPTLYDQGYTSIGSTTNTVPNPALKSIDKFGNVTYKPAYLLEDPSLERSGRFSAKISSEEENSYM